MHVRELTRLECNTIYQKVLEDNDYETMRWLCLNDLFFLLSIGCRRPDINQEWIFQRCREVEVAPDGYIDLWARWHYKSSIITFGLSIKDILTDPEVTIGIFSHTRPIAKAFLAQIKREFEGNEFLKGLFPEILHKEPQKDSPCWSLDNGITVNRKGNPKEATIEAHGLVDGQPTSRHFSILNYDDVVTLESVSTPEQIEKTTNAWSISLNLGTEKSRRRILGTRYHARDTYQHIIERGAAIPRVHPATDDGTRHGRPVLISAESLEDKFREMGSYVASSQLLLNPLADTAMGFHPDWWEGYDKPGRSMNFYITVDPASKKKKDNDYTVILVIGLADDGNYYLVDGVRDRMNLTERTKALFRLHRKWRPRSVGYEEYGLQADIEHIRYVQEQDKYRFNIVELGGQISKKERVLRLVPIFEQHRFYIPHRLLFITLEGKTDDLSALIRNEYDTFPVSEHDDAMDCLARILDADLGAVFPIIEQRPQQPQEEQKYDPYKLQEA